MEALVPAFLLALLSQLGDRPALLTAALADRYRAPLLVALAGLLAHGAGNALAALAGAALAPMLTPEARALLVAVALVTGGLGGFWPLRPPERLERWKLGPFLTPLLGTFVLALGGAAQFFTFALAAGGLPWFAAIGATIGAGAVAFAAAVMGEKGWRALPLRWLLLVPALLFVIAGSWMALGALRLLG